MHSKGGGPVRRAIDIFADNAHLAFFTANTHLSSVHSTSAVIEAVVPVQGAPI